MKRKVKITLTATLVDREKRITQKEIKGHLDAITIQPPTEGGSPGVIEKITSVEIDELDERRR